MAFTSASVTKNMHEVVVISERAQVQVGVQVAVVSDIARCLLVVSAASTKKYLNVGHVDNLDVARVLVETLVVDRRVVL